MTNLITEQIETSLHGKYVKFDDEGHMPAMRVMSLEYVDASDPKYGDNNGKQYKLTFEGDHILTTVSKRFVHALKEAKVDVGDVIEITRFGSGFETQYTVNVVEQSPI